MGRDWFTNTHTHARTHTHNDTWTLLQMQYRMHWLALVHGARWHHASRRVGGEGPRCPEGTANPLGWPASHAHTHNHIHMECALRVRTWTTLAECALTPSAHSGKSTRIWKVRERGPRSPALYTFQSRIVRMRNLCALQKCALGLSGKLSDPGAS